MVDSPSALRPRLDGMDPEESDAMSKRWSRIGLGVFCLGVVYAAGGATPPLQADDTAKPPAPISGPSGLGALIDRYVAEGYAAKKATPAAPADDAEFLRRVTLDLA